jgi:iron(III) transport system permease protein
VLALAVLAPLATLAVLAGPPRQVLAGLAAVRGEIGYSLAVAALVAVAALPLCLAMAHALERPGWPGALAWAAVCLPLAVPPSLVGIGLVAVFNQRYLPLHGTALMPVLAGLARFVPVMTLLVYAQLRRVDPRLLDAARVFGPGPWTGFARVKLPLMLPGLVGAACAGFALTVGELGATLIVAPAGRGTLTMRAFNYLHYGASEGVAGLCLLLVLVAMAAGLLAAAAMGRMGGVHSRPAGSSP